MLKRLLLLAGIGIGVTIALRAFGVRISAGEIVLNEDRIRRLGAEGSRKLIHFGECVVEPGLAPETLARVLPKIVVVGEMVVDRDIVDALGKRLVSVGSVRVRKPSPGPVAEEPAG